MPQAMGNAASVATLQPKSDIQPRNNKQDRYQYIAGPETAAKQKCQTKHRHNARGQYIGRYELSFS